MNTPTPTGCTNFSDCLVDCSALDTLGNAVGPSCLAGTCSTYDNSYCTSFPASGLTASAMASPQEAIANDSTLVPVSVQLDIKDTDDTRPIITLTSIDSNQTILSGDIQRGRFRHR